ncbi:hypothetical protein ATKI12_0637 [Kitasatospora sp. Ki12]|uniref:hypothetical protein n=1 Tax=Kitasatospora xanthocidica TaxID=83382 RepID=UPI00167901EE|nr:hypothetical protein [Kitasatospora xanthocidica]GHF79167.1 hypothetical protein GCM10018790_66290 [Kitasatospora xanthocidica]
MRTLARRSRGAGPLALVAALLGLLLLLAPAASAAGGLSNAAATLKKGQVYVDPTMLNRFSQDQADALTKKIEKADKPIFIAVVPDAANKDTVLTDLRTLVGIDGVYGVWRGTGGFLAHADRGAMGVGTAERIAGAVGRADKGDINATLNDFVDQAAPQTKGQGVNHSTSIAWVVIPVVLVALAGAGVFFLFRRAKKRKEEQARAELEQVSRVVDEDITAFGEELDRLDFNPGAADADDAQRTDYTHALDSYEKSKRLMAEAKRPEDVKPVTEAIEDGRFALATLSARRDKRPLPERRPPCFMDPRHGPSVKDVDWAPAGGSARSVPVCQADADRVAAGLDPAVRTVDTEHGPQPYWNAGPAYAPYAGGYYSSFGGGLLPGLLVGTMLGSMMSTPAYAAPMMDGGHHGYQDQYEGGDYTGADFNAGDFSGGGWSGGGDSGGGDFGGGDW